MRSHLSKLALLIMLLFMINTVKAQHHHHSHDGLHHWEMPSKDPDRIILTFNGDPATSRAVTWRTDTSINQGVAQIAKATVNSKFINDAVSINATLEEFDLGAFKENNSLLVHYHSVQFEGLEPNQLYTNFIPTELVMEMITGRNGYNLKQPKLAIIPLNSFILEMHRTMCFLTGLELFEWLIKPLQMLHLLFMLVIL